VILKLGPYRMAFGTCETFSVLPTIAIGGEARTSSNWEICFVTSLCWGRSSLIFWHRRAEVLCEP
jgi:hypothetical protein